MDAALIMLREGFEAALLVAIVLVYLGRIHRPDLRGAVWRGVGLAAVLSVGVGVAIHLTIGSLEGAARLRAFAAVSFLAASVLTWMLFWMRRQARAVKNDLEIQIDRALEGERVGLALGAVAFFAVVREGLEAALFLIAAATESSGPSILIGGALGLGAAVGLAVLVYVGGRRLPMRIFFQVTGLVLILFAAGLLARGVLYLQIAGDAGSFDLNGVYDLRSQAWLTQNTESGKLLAALLGWDPRPSIEQVVVWLGYAVPTTVLFFRNPKEDEEAAEVVEVASEAVSAQVR